MDLISKNPKHHVLDVGKINELSAWELIQIKDLIDGELKDRNILDK